MANTLGKMIKKARLEKGWSREDFAEKIGRRRITVYRQEADKDYFGDEILKKACKLLGLDYAEALALKHPEHAAVFSEEKAGYDTQTEKVLDEAQNRGYKGGGIPGVLPTGIIQRLRGGGPYRSIDDLRETYEQLKKSDPMIAAKCEICEIMESETLSPEDYTEIKNYIKFRASKTNE